MTPRRARSGAIFVRFGCLINPVRQTPLLAARSCLTSSADSLPGHAQLPGVIRKLFTKSRAAYRRALQIRCGVTRSLSVSAGNIPETSYGTGRPKIVLFFLGFTYHNRSAVQENLTTRSPGVAV